MATTMIRPLRPKERVLARLQTEVPILRWGGGYGTSRDLGRHNAMPYDHPIREYIILDPGKYKGRHRAKGRR